MKIKMKSAIFLLLLCVDFSFGQLGGLSAKLDFGETETTTSPQKVIETIVSVRQSSPKSQKLLSSTDSLFNIRKISLAADAAAEKIKEDFKSLSLICKDGVCNTENKKDQLKSDDLKADVIVKVISKDTKEDNNKTKIDIKGSDGDVDVPVIVGTDNKNIENRIDSHRSPQFIPYNINRNYQQNFHNQYPVPHFNPNYNNHYFGESAPPTYVWHKRRNNVHNPHAFVSNSVLYYPSNNWRRSAPSYANKKSNNPVLCTCANNQPVNWNPVIDDKMEHV